jgi:MscS family membrane protein
MTSRLVWTLALWCALAHSAAAQIPGLDSLGTPATREREQAEDPLGRTTPRKSIVAFIRAVDREDFVSAARYMQVTASQRRNTEMLARELKTLLDRFFSQAVTSISSAPEGALDDGLPLDREAIGPLTIGTQKSDILLVRVTDPQSGPIWLISSETLAQVPALYEAIPMTWVERVLPNVLVRRELFGISYAHWVVFAASLVMPFLLLVLASSVVIVLSRRFHHDATSQRNLAHWVAELRWPAILTLMFVSQLVSMPLLGLPLTLRFGYARVGLVLLVISSTWLLREVLTLGFARTRSMVWGKDRTSTQSLMLLGERLLKVLLVIVAIFIILTIVGVDTKTALAGLGIGGVALALGAQKTIENLLGGVFLLSDRALAIGDMCTISNRQGQVEDITLRSVRLRTADQSLVSVPAGALAQAEIENFASRQKMLVRTTLPLRYGTTVDQIRRILGEVRTLLDETPQLETGTSRITLVNFGREAIELELFAFVRTTDASEFLNVREDLLLAIAAIVEAAGSGFAEPVKFISAGEVPDSDSARNAKAEEPRAGAQAPYPGMATSRTP